MAVGGHCRISVEEDAGMEVAVRIKEETCLSGATGKHAPGIAQVIRDTRQE